MNLTDIFVETLYTLKSQPLPEEIKLEARKCLMDEVSTMLAGAVLQKDKLNTYLDCFTGEDATVVATGGLCPVIVPNCSTEITVDDHLLVEGLRLIYERNR